MKGLTTFDRHPCDCAGTRPGASWPCTHLPGQCANASAERDPNRGVLVTFSWGGNVCCASCGGHHILNRQADDYAAWEAQEDADELAMALATPPTVGRAAGHDA